MSGFDNTNGDTSGADHFDLGLNFDSQSYLGGGGNDTSNLDDIMNQVDATSQFFNLDLFTSGTTGTTSGSVSATTDINGYAVDSNFGIGSSSLTATVDAGGYAVDSNFGTDGDNSFDILLDQEAMASLFDSIGTGITADNPDTALSSVAFSGIQDTVTGAPTTLVPSDLDVLHSQSTVSQQLAIPQQQSAQQQQQQLLQLQQQQQQMQMPPPPPPPPAASASIKSPTPTTKKARQPKAKKTPAAKEKTVKTKGSRKSTPKLKSPTPSATSLPSETPQPAGVILGEASTSAAVAIPSPLSQKRPTSPADPMRRIRPKFGANSPLVSNASAPGSVNPNGDMFSPVNAPAAMPTPNMAAAVMGASMASS
ncbi:hypothetical protein FBU59_006583, partial [Linderina macrospora]